MKNCGFSSSTFERALNKTIKKYKSSPDIDSGEFFSNYILNLKDILKKYPDRIARLNEIFDNKEEDSIKEIFQYISDAIGAYSRSVVSKRTIDSINDQKFINESNLSGNLNKIENIQTIIPSLTKGFKTTTVPGTSATTSTDDDIKGNGMEDDGSGGTDSEEGSVYGSGSTAPVEEDTYISRINSLEEDPTIHDIAKEVFKNSSYLLEGLVVNFKRTFYDKLLDLKGEYPKGIAASLSDAINEMKEVFTEQLGEFDPNVKISELLGNKDLENQLIAHTTLKYFDTFAKEYMTGVNLNSVRFNEKTGVYEDISYGTDYTQGVHKGFESGEAVTAISQASPMDKMHCNNIPRLKKVVLRDLFNNVENGKEKLLEWTNPGERNNTVLAIDSEKPFLTYEEVKNLCDILSKSSRVNSLAAFKRDLKNPEKFGLGKVTESALESIYYRFYAPNAYKVYSENEPPKVYSSMDRTLKVTPQLNNFNNKLKSMLNSVARTSVSAANKESFIVQNGKPMHSRTTVNDISTTMFNDFYSNITDSLDPSKIKNSIARNIRFLPGKKLNGETVSSMGIAIGEFVINLDVENTERFISEGSINGSVVNAITNSKDPGYKGSDVSNLMNNVSNIRKCFRMLGFDNKLGNSFIEAYIQNQNERTVSEGVDMTIPSLLANVAFMIKANTDEGLKFLQNKQLVPQLSNGVVLDEEQEIAARSQTALAFPIFDYVGRFSFPMVEYLNKIYAPDRSATRRNLNNDTVATQSVITRFDEFPKLLAQIDKTINSGKSTYFKNNPFVARLSDGGKEVTLMKLYEKYGTEKGEAKRDKKEMTHYEHMKLLIEDAYLKVGAESKYNNIDIQPAEYSDRSSITLANLAIRDGRATLFPTSANINEWDGSLTDDDVPEIKDDKRYNERNHIIRFKKFLSDEISATAESTLNGWNKFFESHPEYKYKPTNDLEALFKFLESAKIPYSLVEQSKDLTANMHYIKEKSGSIKYATLHNTLVEMNDAILKDNGLIEAFIEFSKNKFLQDVRDTGYLNDKSSLDSDSLNILKELYPGHSEEELPDVLLQSYFYNSNIYGNSMLTLLMGNDFLYKSSNYSIKDLPLNNSKEAQKKDLFYMKHKIEESEDIASIEDSKERLKAKKIKRQCLVWNENLGGKFLAKTKRNAAIGSGTQKIILAKGSVQEYNKVVDEILIQPAISENNNNDLDLNRNSEESGIYLDMINSDISHKQAIFAISKTFTEEFKQWFGDWSYSEDPEHGIINEDGTPKVLYIKGIGHGYVNDSNLQGEDINTISEAIQEDPSIFKSIFNKGAFDMNTDSIYDYLPERYEEEFSNALEEGPLLSETCKSAVIDDPAWFRLVMGSFNIEGIDTYDAAAPAHPLYFIMLENGLGNEYSGFNTNGGAVKDITFSINDEKGTSTFQKKATFNIFSNELLRKGTRQLWDLFYKMNTSIPMGNYSIKVPEVDNEYNDPIQNDISGEYVYQTKSFANMYELWNYFGGINNDKAWNHIAEVLGENPEVRDLYIQKINFKSGEKVGNTAVSPANVLSDKKVPLNYTTINNNFHGVILNSYHLPDTTASYDDSGDLHSNEVSLMTQAVGASVFEGNTFDCAERINSTLLKVAELNLNTNDNNLTKEGQLILKSIVSEIKSKNLNDNLEVVLADVDAELKSRGLPTYEELKATLDLTDVSKENMEHLQKVLESSGLLENIIDSYIRTTTKRALEQREAYGVNVDLLNDKGSSLGIKQLVNTIHSNLMSDMTKKAIRIKFPGGQYVVSPAADFLKLYTLPNGSRVNKTSYERMILKHFFNPQESKDSPRTAQEISSYNLFRTIYPIDLIKHTFTDGNGKVKIEFLNKSKLNRKLRKSWGVLKTESFEDYFNMLLQNGHKFHTAIFPEAKITNLVTGDGKKNSEKLITTEVNDNQTLQWAVWQDSEGNLSIDLPEFKNLLLLNSFKGTDEEISEGIIPKTFKDNAVELDNLNELISRSGNNKNTFEALLFKQMEEKFADKSKGWKLIQEAEVMLPMLHKTSFDLREEDELSEILGDHITFDKTIGEGEKEKILYNHRFNWFKKNANRNSLVRQLFSKRININNEEDRQNLINKINRRLPEISDNITISTALKMFKEGLTKGTITDKIVNDIKDTVSTELATIRATNFPKSLSLITGRIPGQGMQSYVSAKVKGFINSTQNTSYAPIEQNIVTGQDHDIDKTNLMVYSVDKYGSLFDYKPYIKDFDPSIDSFRQEIDLDLYDKILENKINEYKESIKDKKINDSDIADKVKSIVKTEQKKCTEALKNYLLDNLRETSKDVRNSVASGSPMDMGKLKNINKKFIKLAQAASVKANKSYFGENSASPYNPFAIIAYEIENVVGKDAVGVFAAAIKTYSALYTTWLSDVNAKELEYPSNFKNILEDATSRFKDKTKVDLIRKRLDKYYKKWALTKEIDVKDRDYYEGDLDGFNKSIVANNKDIIKVNRNALTLHLNYEDIVNGKTVKKQKILRSTTLSNTQKKITESALEILQNSKKSNYSDSVINYYLRLQKDSLPESQAWLDLSILISAATDNAKELILDKIGANSITNGIISTMIMAGFDIDNVITFIKTPEIQEAINKIKTSQNIELKTDDGVVTLDNLVKDSRSSSNILDILSADNFDEKTAFNAFDNYFFNPLGELEKFNKAAKEIRIISGVLSINQQIPSSQYEVYKYLNNINNGINKIYKDNGIEIKDFYNPKAPNPDNCKFDIFKFVDDPEYRDFHINRFNEIKSAFNIPYVIAQNDHFFGYLKGLHKGYSYFNSVTTNYKSIDIFSDILTENNVITSEKGLKEDQFDELTDFYYGLQIVDFFEEKTRTKGEFNFRNKKYDLGKAQDRNDLLQETVKVVQKIKQDPEKDVKLKNRLLDYFNVIQFESQGKTMLGLKTFNLNAVDPVIESIMMSEYEKLKTQDPELHDALFYYTLITEKGSRSKRSFAQIIDSNTFSEYSNYAKTYIGNDSKLKELYDININSIVSCCPSLVPVYSTAKGSFKPKKSVDPEMEAEMMDAMPEEALEYSGKKELPNKFNSFDLRNGIDKTNKSLSAFLKWEKGDKKKTISSFPKKLKVFKSKETGRLYHIYTYTDENGNKQNKAVEIVPKTPMQAIPYSSKGGLTVEEEKDEMITLFGNSLRQSGFQIGRTVKISNEGELGNVVSWDNNTKKYNVRHNGKSFTMEPTILQYLNPSLIFQKDYVGKANVNKKLANLYGEGDKVLNVYGRLLNDNVRTKSQSVLVNGMEQVRHPKELNSVQKEIIDNAIKYKWDFKLAVGKYAYINKLLFDYIKKKSENYFYSIDSSRLSYRPIIIDSLVSKEAKFKERANVFFSSNSYNFNSFIKNYYDQEISKDKADRLKLEYANALKEKYSEKNQMKESSDYSKRDLDLSDYYNARRNYAEALLKELDPKYVDNYINPETLKDTDYNLSTKVGKLVKKPEIDSSKIYFTSLATSVPSISNYAMNNAYSKGINTKVNTIEDESIIEDIYNAIEKPKGISPSFGKKKYKQLINRVILSASEQNILFATRIKAGTVLADETIIAKDSFHGENQYILDILKYLKDNKVLNNPELIIFDPVTKEWSKNGKTFKLSEKDINTSASILSETMEEFNGTINGYEPQYYKKHIFNPSISAIKEMNDLIYNKYKDESKIIVKNNKILSQFEIGAFKLINKLGLNKIISPEVFTISKQDLIDTFGIDSSEYLTMLKLFNLEDRSSDVHDIYSIYQDIYAEIEDEVNTAYRNKREINYIDDGAYVFFLNEMRKAIKQQNVRNVVLEDIKERDLSNEQSITYLKQRYIQNKPSATNLAIKQILDSLEGSEDALDLFKLKAAKLPEGNISDMVNEFIDSEDNSIINAKELLIFNYPNAYFPKRAIESLNNMFDYSIELMLDYNFTLNKLYNKNNIYGLNSDKQYLITNYPKEVYALKTILTKFPLNKVNKDTIVDIVGYYKNDKKYIPALMSLINYADNIEEIAERKKKAVELDKKAKEEIEKLSKKRAKLEAEKKKKKPSLTSTSHFASLSKDQVDSIILYIDNLPEKVKKDKIQVKSYVKDYILSGANSIIKNDLNKFTDEDFDKMVDLYFKFMGDSSNLSGNKIAESDPIKELGRLKEVYKGSSVAPELDDLGNIIYIDKRSGETVPFQIKQLDFSPLTGNEKLKSERVGKEVMDFIYSKLESLYPEIGIEVLSSADIEIQYGKLFSDKSGFALEDKIVINSDLATLDTPMHEFGGHIYMKYLKNAEPEVYNEIIAKCLNHPIANEIRNSYTWLNSDENIGEEIFATLMGLESQNLVKDAYKDQLDAINNTQKKAKKSFWKWLKDMFSSLFGIKSTPIRLVKTDSLKDVFNKIGTDILYNDGEMLNSYVYNNKNNNIVDSEREYTINDAIPIKDFKLAIKQELDYDDIRRSLEEQGFIKYICS